MRELSEVEKIEQQLVELERLRLQNESCKRKSKARANLKVSLSNKSFIDFRDVRLDLPPKPAAGYSLTEWDEIEKKIVQALVDKNCLKLPTCRFDNYLGMLTVSHPELFEAEFHGYVSNYLIEFSNFR